MNSARFPYLNPDAVLAQAESLKSPASFNTVSSFDRKFLPQQVNALRLTLAEVVVCAKCEWQFWNQLLERIWATSWQPLEATHYAPSGSAPFQAAAPGTDSATADIDLEDPQLSFSKYIRALGNLYLEEIVSSYRRHRVRFRQDTNLATAQLSGTIPLQVYTHDGWQLQLVRYSAHAHQETRLNLAGALYLAQSHHFRLADQHQILLANGKTKNFSSPELDQLWQPAFHRALTLKEQLGAEILKLHPRSRSEVADSAVAASSAETWHCAERMYETCADQNPVLAPLLSVTFWRRLSKVCGSCSYCQKAISAFDDPMMISGLGASLRKLLADQQIYTRTELLHRRPATISPYLLHQADLQLQQQKLQAKSPFSKVKPLVYQVNRASSSLSRLPDTHRGDLYLDFECDSLWGWDEQDHCGLIYLAGVARPLSFPPLNEDECRLWSGNATNNSHQDVLESHTALPSDRKYLSARGTGFTEKQDINLAESEARTHTNDSTCTKDFEDLLPAWQVKTHQVASKKGELSRTLGADYLYWWAHSFAQEEQLLVALVNWLTQQVKRNPGLHIYHYSGQEVLYLKRMSARYHRVEKELADLFQHNVFVDLLPIVQASVVTGQTGYSLKSLEPLYMGKWLRGEQLNTGADSVVLYDRLHRQAYPQPQRETPVLNQLATYNEYDCCSTMLLHRWLLSQRNRQPRP